MSEYDAKIDQLQQRLESLAKYQQDVQREIANIDLEVKSLRAAAQPLRAEPPPDAPKKPQIREYVPPSRSYHSTFLPQKPAPVQPSGSTDNTALPPGAQAAARQVKSDLEKFIGENLISKVGIVITVLGVAVGAKYAVDNNLISPLGRIVLGYLFGFGLLAIAVRLKEKYLNFSAVLLSGAMAIHYFITFAAYSFYSLMSQSSAFAMMLIFTVFTVLTAVRYDRQVIAHIGLVGAYTIPFLLSDGEGNYAFLLSYIAIINVGILAVSIKKYWKSLYYAAFIVTWTTFSGLLVNGLQRAEHFQLAMTFLVLFFAIFYLTFVAYKTINKEKFTAVIAFLVIANSFVFYGLGYSLIDIRADARQFLGLFTLANAFLHFIVGAIASRYDLADKSSINLITALVLTFVTIAVPVHFRGDWLILLWSAEAALLFGIGRTKSIALYEYFSYPLMALSSVALWVYWQYPPHLYILNESQAAPAPFFNSRFLTALSFAAAFVFVYFLNKHEKYAPSVSRDWDKITRFAIPAVLLLALYNTFRLEIGNFWDFRLPAHGGRDVFDNPSSAFRQDMDLFNLVWQINYTLLFLTVLSAANIALIKSSILALINLGLKTLFLIIFLSGGLYALGELRESYLQPAAPETSSPDIFYILTRYFSFVFVSALFLVSYQTIKQAFTKKILPFSTLSLAYDFVFYVSLWIISGSELIHWLDIYGYGDSYKLGLSILWGIYALLLIILGISRNKKHLRVGAIVLFALTLAKVFIYDIADLDTISKTVVFVSLGILLLLISFLYNKYKHLIAEPGNDRSL